MSEGSHQQQPIIIKRVKKRGHGGHHGGAWKVALADFMTAMMAFFLVMWLVGQKPEVRESVAGYFRDPGKYQNMGGAGFLKGGKSAISLKNKSQVIKKKNNKDSDGATEAEKKKMSTAAKKILEELRKQPAFGKLQKNIKIQLTSEGLRIILNESENSPAFFEPGSRKLLQRSAIILMTIAKELGTLENKLVIEGHTDASFGGRSEYSNWELSSDRANSARALMEVSGLSGGQVREVRGFADSYPMIVDNPDDHRNRRISLVVLYKSRETYYDQLAIGGDLMDEIL